jgi:hypothetical protein
MICSGYAGTKVYMIVLPPSHQGKSEERWVKVVHDIGKGGPGSEL